MKFGLKDAYVKALNRAPLDSELLNANLSFDSEYYSIIWMFSFKVRDNIALDIDVSASNGNILREYETYMYNEIEKNEIEKEILKVMNK